MNSCSSISVGMQNYVTSRAVWCVKNLFLLLQRIVTYNKTILYRFLYTNIICSCSLHLYTCIQEIPFTHSQTQQKKNRHEVFKV